MNYTKTEYPEIKLLCTVCIMCVRENEIKFYYVQNSE